MDDHHFSLSDLCVGIDEATSPEKRLLWAVLERSVNDLDYNCSAEGSARVNAVNWVTAKRKNSDTHFTFYFICEALDLGAGIIEKILQLAGIAREREDARIRRELVKQFEESKTSLSGN